jgi:hypothetical protein
VRIATLFALTMAFAASPALAQQAAPACPVVPVPLPAGLEGWVVAKPVPAAAKADDLAGAQLVIGERADVRLLPAPQIAYATPPEKPGKAESHGGMLGFTVQAAGTYRVALGAGAWIDVLLDGKAVAATAHAHGKPCSSIRKMVDFALTPGRYVLQVSGNPAPTVSLMLAHAP